MIKLQFSKAINLKCKLKNSTVKMISKDFNLKQLILRQFAMIHTSTHKAVVMNFIPF